MAGNPARLQLRAAFGNQEQGAISLWRGFRALNETLGIELPTIQDESIGASVYRPLGLETKIEPGGDFSANHGAEEHHIFLANFMGAGTTPAESPSTVFTQTLATDETDETYGPLLIEVSRDLGQPTVHREAEVSQVTFTVGPRAILNGTYTIIAPRMDTWEDATEVAVTATPNAPRIRGLHDYANLAAADGDIFIRVASVASPNITIEAKVGAAAAYSATQVIPAATWTDLVDEAGDPIGTVDLPVQIYFPDDTLTAADEWRVDRERALWAQSLPTASPLNEIAVTILVDGVAFRTREISMTAARPIELDEVIGGRFMDDAIERGFRTVEGELNRRALDLTLINRLVRAQTFSARIDAYGKPIASTTTRQRISIILPNCRPSGRTPSVSGQATFDESFNFEADDLSFEIVNSIADIAAAA